MIIIRIKGGLGNQLFQYALGLYIEQNTGLIVKYDITWYKLLHRQVTSRDFALKLVLNKFDNKIASNTEISRVKIFYFLNLLFPNNELVDYLVLVLNKYLNRSYYIEKSLSTDFKKIINSKYLDGYWQTSFFVSHVKDMLLNNFNNNFINNFSLIHNYGKHITSDDVAVHIRRGDYITNNSANSYHGVCALEYYEKSIEYFKQIKITSKFYFFSDDIEWVKKSFGVNKNYIFVETEIPNSDLEEFFLMSQFKNFIIANSTFSWWAAVISNTKNVIAPKRWFSGIGNHLALKDWKVF